MQQLVHLVKTVDGNLLVIVVDAAARQEIAEISANQDRDAWGKVADVFDYWFCNGWRWVQPHEIGALTDCELILADEWTEDEEGDLVDVGPLYWFPAYAVRDPIAELASAGVLRLDGVDK